MKLSISNIAWSNEHDDEIYEFLSKTGFTGLEIAPTRIFPEAPYDKLTEATGFKNKLLKQYNLKISSMQSIWFGITESIFGGESDRRSLVDYTKKAIDFAEAAGCPNLVFGCPKNRIIPETMSLDECQTIAVDFFNRIGDYAAIKNTYISIEANPTIYGTNFINTTAQALELNEQISNPGIRVNLDLGTIIHNNEGDQLQGDDIRHINHVHISEPRLVPLEKRRLHINLIKELKSFGYDRYISIEMGNNDDLDIVENTILYIKDVYENI